MKNIVNQKGVTLVEVLASMVILSIVLISFMSIFPQMGLINKQNANKSLAINEAKQLLIDWENRSDVKSYLTNPNTTTLTNPPQQDNGYYVFTTTDTQGKFTAKVKIQITPSKTSKRLVAHLMIVQLFNKNNSGNPITETYGYIIR